MKYIANLNDNDKIELSANDYQKAKEVIITVLGKFNNCNIPHKLIAIGEEDIDFFILYPIDKFIKREE